MTGDITTPAAPPAVAAALERARPVADAVLYEGYLLYPYRASATKNQLRWQFGVLMPPAYAANGTGERDRLGAQCLLDAPRPDDAVHVRLRFLRLCHRRPENARGRPVDVLTAADAEWTRWDEATEVELDTSFAVPALLAAPAVFPVDLPATTAVEPVTGGRLVRESPAVTGQLRLRAEPLSGPYGGVRLHVDVANTWPSPVPGDRDAALEHALIGAHAVLAGPRFLSLTDPPEWARPAAAECEQDGAWPVLLGSDDNAVLVSPIILEDNPEIAPESPANLFDGTEIDEILSLRTLALTDEEKRAARATDPRARALLDHVDGLPAEVWDRLHGAVRSLRAVTDDVPTYREPDAEAPPWWDPGADTSVSPETDHVVVDGVEVARGSRVRLRPGSTRADAQDMFVAGRVAVVQAVLFDVDGARHLAVTIEDDPAADLEILQGRFRYFAPDEVEPLPGGTP